MALSRGPPPIERRVITTPPRESKVREGVAAAARPYSLRHAMPRVSFVITIYNKAPALPFLIAGLAAQEGKFEREFIFVDDGSTDGGADLLRELTRGWSEVTIIEQKNSGPAVAMNAGVGRAAGDFIKPMDGDDLLLPWGTQRLLQAIDQTGCDVAFAAGGGSYDTAARPEYVIARWKPQPERIKRCDDMLARSLRRAHTTPSAWLARADTVRRAGGCDERVFIQDYSIELRLAALGPFARLEETIFLAVEALPGRLGGNQAQALHDLNLALAYFVADHPALQRALARAAFIRAAGRAWAWARRRGGKTMLSREFGRVCGARSGLLPPSPANFRASCAIFAETAPIRRAGDMAKR
jgi:hypothetical protein